MLSVNDLEVCDSMIEVSIKHACTHGFLLKIATCKKIVHGKNYFMQKKKTRWSQIKVLIGLGIKLEDYLDGEDTMLEENKELIVNFGQFERD